MKTANAAFLAWSFAVVFSDYQEVARKPPDLLWRKETIQDLSGTRNLGSPKLIESSRAGVVFLDGRRIMVYEIINTGQLSSRKSPEVSSAFSVHSTVLDTSSGAVLFGRDWGTRAHASSIHVSSGGLILVTGPVVRFLTKDLTEIKQLPVPHPDPYEGWEIRTSPSGKSVLLNHYIRNRRRGLNFSEFELLDGGTFERKYAWTQSPALNGDLYSISDSAIARKENQHNPEQLQLSEFGITRWRNVWVLPEKGCLGRATLVSDDGFVYGCKDLWLVSNDGKILMRDAFQKGEGVGIDHKFALAQDGKAVALSLENIKDPWDTGGHLKALHIAVYDLSLRKRVLTVDVNPMPKNDFDFALSPDGSKLAVLNDRDVSVYIVPSD